MLSRQSIMSCTSSESAAMRTVVGFTDETGRTSCASTEDEHYQLRCLALAQVARATANDLTNKKGYKRIVKSFAQALYKECHRGPPRFIGELYSTTTALTARMERQSIIGPPLSGSPRNEKSAFYMRRLTTLRFQIDNATKKLDRVQNELETVAFRCAAAQGKELCDTLFEKLPTELVDLVQSYVGNFEQPIGIGTMHSRTPPTRFWDTSPTTPYQKMPVVWMFLGYSKWWNINTPWYLDTRIVTPEFASRMLKTMYRNAIFLIDGPDVVDRFLNESRWIHIPGHAAPKDFVRNLRVMVPYIRHYKDCVEATRVDRLIQKLQCLRTLKSVKVHISFDIIEWTINMSELTSSNLFKRINLFMMDLRNEGHIVKMNDEYWNGNQYWEPRGSSFYEGEYELDTATGFFL